MESHFFTKQFFYEKKIAKKLSYCISSNKLLGTKKEGGGFLS